MVASTVPYKGLLMRLNEKLSYTKNKDKREQLELIIAIVLALQEMNNKLDAALVSLEKSVDP